MKSVRIDAMADEGVPHGASVTMARLRACRAPVVAWASADSWARRVSGRMLARIALVAGSFATSACEDVCCLLDIDPANADIDIPVAGSDWDAWAAGWVEADSVVTWHGSLRDSAGLAGMELEILGQTFRARDFLDGKNPWWTIRVPRSGTLHVFFRLADKGQQIAEDQASWRLQSEDEWLLRIIRGPRDGRCPLRPYPCEFDARLPIDDRFANYPGEAVWLILLGVSGPGELFLPW